MIIGECPFWKNDNKLSVSKVDCGDNTLLSPKKRVEDFTFLKKNQQCTCQKLCSLKLNIVRVSYRWVRYSHLKSPSP